MHKPGATRTPLERIPLYPTQLARTYSANLPAGHPIKTLFEGGFRWIAHIPGAFTFLWVLDQSHGISAQWRSLNRVAEGRERSGHEEFIQARNRLCRMYPEGNDCIIIGGKPHRARRLFSQARNGIKTAHVSREWMKAFALDAYDQAFVQLVLRIRPQQQPKLPQASSALSVASGLAIK